MFVRWSAAIAAISLLSGAAFAEGAKPTDPQIAHIAYTAGVIDVTAAKQALAKTSNKDVKEFAENMVRDHEAVNKQALDLVKKLKVTPEDNDTSKSLSKNATAKLDELARLMAGASVSAHAAIIQITMENLVISPAEASAKVGDTVEWINKDIFAHTATARNGDWDVTLQPKKTATLVLKKAGAIQYYCRFHPNMKATLTVAP